MDDKEFNEILKREALLALSQGGNPQNAFREAEAKIDVEVYKRATACIAETQFRLAKNILVKMRFKTPLSVFSDQSFLRDRAIERIDPKLYSSIRQEFMTRSRLLKETELRTILGKVPADRNQLLVDLFGNDLYPELTPKFDGNRPPPFGSSANAGQAIPLIIHNPALAERMKLSEDQRTTLSDVFNAEEEAIVRSLTGSTSPERIQRFWSESNMRRAAAYTKTLSMDQRLVVSRWMTMRELELNAPFVFDRAEVLSYLDLPEALRIEIRKTAMDADREYKKAYEALCKETFDKLCDGVSDPSKRKLLALFDGVW